MDASKEPPGVGEPMNEAVALAGDEETTEPQEAWFVEIIKNPVVAYAPNGDKTVLEPGSFIPLVRVLKRGRTPYIVYLPGFPLLRLGRPNKLVKKNI